MPGSRNDLESLLGSRVVSFAYPFGFKSDAVVESARGAFDLAVGIDPDEPGLNYMFTDPLQLQRTMVQTNDSVIDIECRVRWGYSPIQRLRAQLRLRTHLKHAVRALFGKGADS